MCGSFFDKGFRAQKNKWGLYCYTGKQGTGKTYSAIKFLINQKNKYDYKIITNVTSFKGYDNIIYMTNINDIINYCESFIENEGNVIIFFDEIFTILNKNTKINESILSFLSQLRKRKIIFITTAQEWGEVNITFRRYVRYQVECNLFSFFGYAFIFNSINDGDMIRWNNDLQDWIAPRVSANFSKGNLYVIESYDTFETIKTGKIIK